MRDLKSLNDSDLERLLLGVLEERAARAESKAFLSNAPKPTLKEQISKLEALLEQERGPCGTKLSEAEVLEIDRRAGASAAAAWNGHDSALLAKSAARREAQTRLNELKKALAGWP